MKYYQQINEVLFNILPSHQKKVLEFSCGTGALGKHYKNTYSNTDTTYYGIEIVKEIAKEAEKNLDHVLQLNVEDTDQYLDSLDNNFDLLIYGDVLEHLINPWDTLSAHKKLLKDDGFVCASIPNISHWSIIEDLILGKWEYKNAGLLDKTHLRFFTLSSVHQLFEQAGFKLLKIEPTYQGKNHKKNHFFTEEFYEHASQELGKDKSQIKFEMNVYQYICLAQKIK